jgi:hypothetical protein
MAKLISLDDSWREPFRESLNSSPIFGPLLAEAFDLNVGRLEAWVPDAIESVPLQNLLRDPFYPGEGFGHSEALCCYLEEYLRKDPERLSITDTRRTTAWTSMWGDPKIPWFTCDSPSIPGELTVCVYVTGAEASEQTFDELLNESNQWPQMLVLTSQSTGMPLISGCHLAPESPLLTALAHRAEHVLLGVFDGTSHIVWSRG